jgi:hypothetical protein
MAMPIQYLIDASQRVVFAKGRGILAEQDFFCFQQTVWSAPEVAGFDELIDMTETSDIVSPSPKRVQALADFAVKTDPPDVSSRLAIVAPDPLAYGLGRMYGIYRELNPKSTKTVAVFRSRPEALRWLGVNDHPPDLPHSTINAP